MILKVFTIYDSKAETYSKPFYMTATGEAVRAFGDLANNQDTDIGKHPEDYTLFAIAEFNDNNGTFEPYDTKSSLGQAHEHLSIIN